MLFLTLALVLAMPAYAQDPAAEDDLEGIDSITVNITRRAMDVQDVNSMVTAFDEETLRSANIDNQEDLVEMIPNVTTKGGRFASISLRGISSGITNQEAVALHSNGVFTGAGSFYDVESVQFDRGPSGSLYGRNATAGALDVTWNKPTPAWETWGELEFANYDQKQLRTGANIPLLGEGDDRLMLRVNMTRNKYDGWLDNEFETRNSDPGNADEYSFWGTLRSVITEDLEASLRFRYAKLQNDVTPSRPLIDRYPLGRIPALTSGAFAGLGPFVSDPYGGFQLFVDDLASQALPALYAVNPALAIGLVTPAIGAILQDPSSLGVSAQPLPANRSDVRTSIHEKGEPEIVRWGFDGEVKWSAHDLPVLGDVDFRLLGGVFQADSKILLDLDGTELHVLDVDRESRNQRWTGELQAVSRNDGPFNWVVGLFYFRNQGHETNVIETPFADLPTTTKLRTSGIAPFANFTYDWNEHLQFQWGVRWSRDVAERHVFRPQAGTVQDESLINSREVYRERTGDFTVRWNFDEDRSVYAKYVRGYRPGGLNTGAGVATSSVAQRSFDPEVIDAYEVGSKNTLLDGLLQLNVAAFWYRYKNLQVPIVTVEGVSTANAASSTNRGVELEVRAPFRSPIDFFDGGMIQGSVGYLHATYDSLCTDDPFENLAVSEPGCEPSVSPFNGERNLSGNHLPDAPRWSAALMVILNKDLGERGSLRFLVRSKFTDDYYLRPENIDEIDLVPNFTRTDIRLVWQSAGEGLSVHLFVENIENRFQFTSTLVGPELVGGLPVGLIIPRTPRRWGVQLEWKFGGN
jgi:outer membrane receptor protein involved in Fe transport